MSAPPFALVGPTAVGKTAIACDLAEFLGAEVVCVDSMSIYRGLDIGTAKPGPAERARVPHHLLDVADPRDPWTAARFQDAARAAMATIRARGTRPMVTGGSGLYFRAAVDPLVFPPTDPAVRARLDAQPLGELVERLKQEDPDAAAFIDPANKRRVVRALEVLDITGRPYSTFRDAWDARAPAAVAGLSLEPDAHRERIRARTDAMLDAGLVEEVRGLLGAGLREPLRSLGTIGYQEAMSFLDGALTRVEMCEGIAHATWRLARRQMSWFRADPRVRWFDAAKLEGARDGIRAYFAEHREE